MLTRILDQIFHDVKLQYVYHYFDDLVIYSENFEEHMVHLREVLARLHAAGLTVNPDKVKFASDQLSFLGHKISVRGVTIDPERTKAILNFLPPRSVKDVARFIGMINYFNKFIPTFADIVALLNALHKDVEFVWDEAHQIAFKKLTVSIMSPQILVMPDFSRHFILQTDASPVALGTVLLQDTPEGQL